MRRFGTAAALGLLLLTGGAWSLAASDTPKTPQSAHRRKAVVPRHQGKADVTLEDLYVDAEIGQVFSVNLGRADQPQHADNAAGSGVVHIYQLSGSEEEPAARVEVAGLANPAAMVDGEDEPAGEIETAPADDAEAMETAGMDPAAAPAEEPVAAPEAAPQNAPPSDPSVAMPPVVKTPASSKDNPKISPSVPPPPPIR